MEPVLHPVRKRDEAGLGIQDGDDQFRTAQDVAHPVTDRVHDRLEVELLAEGGADLVDDRELAVALLGLGEQALRLVEEAGVLERDAHARGEGREQPLVGFAEAVRGHPLQRDRAKDSVAGEDRDAEPGFGFVRAEDDRAASLGLRGRVQAERPARCG